jgi:hypothetical protein
MKRNAGAPGRAGLVAREVAIMVTRSGEHIRVVTRAAALSGQDEEHHAIQR